VTGGRLDVLGSQTSVGDALNELETKLSGLDAKIEHLETIAEETQAKIGRRGYSPRPRVLRTAEGFQITGLENGESVTITPGRNGNLNIARTARNRGSALRADALQPAGGRR
jgi:hypothetical protein